MYVTMLGISGSGKTSYMSGLYETLGVENFANFRIEPVDPDPNKSGIDDILAFGDFEAISFTGSSGQESKFPASTQKTTLWSFDLLYGKSLVGNFNWIDYRGGILTDEVEEIRSNERKKQELEDLSTHVKLTNAVLIFADAILLTHYENLRQARRLSGVDKITNLILQFDRDYPNRNLTYVIVLTKADAVKDEWKLHDYDRLINRGLQAFEKFIDYAKTKPNWGGGIVAVSSSGEGTVDTKITPSKTSQSSLKIETNFIGFPSPLNVGNALFFAIGQTLKQNRARIQMDVGELQREKITLLKKSNIANRIWRFITKQPTPEKVIETIEEQQELYRVRLQQFDPYIEQLLAAANKSVKTIQGY